MHRVCFHAPGPARPARGVPRAGTPPCGRRCSRRCADTGWHNYSLFLRDDGLLVGYLETDDLAAAQAGHGRHRGQRPLAGRDGARSSWTSTAAPDRGLRSCSTRSSTSTTSSRAPP